MNSGQLANAVLDVCLEAQRRIMEEGHKQYSGTEEVPEGNEGLTKEVERQKFEEESTEYTFSELEAELLDTINYAAMAILKLRSAREAVSRAAQGR